MEGVLREFLFAIPKARAPPVEAWCCKPDGSALRRAAAAAALTQREWFERAGPLRTAVVRKQMFFPDRRLLQYDCGKLVELDVLLRRLKTGGHRVLIFTQVRGFSLAYRFTKSTAGQVI
jgi:E1A-binding protein p400